MYKDQPQEIKNDSRFIGMYTKDATKDVEGLGNDLECNNSQKTTRSVVGRQ